MEYNKKSGRHGNVHRFFRDRNPEHSMPATSNLTQPSIVHRGVRLRLLPGTPAVAHQLAGTAGACRFVWNHFLALKRQQYRDYRCWQDYKIGPEKPKLNLTFFGMGLEFTALRHHPHTAWLQDYSFKAVRHILKYLAEAYQAFCKGQRGYPKFKSRYRNQDGFTIPSDVELVDNHLHVPRIGKLRVKGSNLYAASGKALTARIVKAGTAVRPKWYVHVTYAVPISKVKKGAADGTVGLDRNVGQATDSEGAVYPMTHTARLDTKIRHKQRLQARKVKGSIRRRRLGGQLTKLQRKRQRIRHNDTHHIGRRLADKAHTVVVENLHVSSMTKSAKGTTEHPGTNVKAKSGLNREILATNWSQLEQRLAYKCGRLLQVSPAYTSQTCSNCGGVDKHNRPTQADFVCVICGFALNADWNAALNILGRSNLPVARGTGATARREAFSIETFMTREQDMSEPLCYLGI